jgi:hypothetical protein
VRIAVWLSILAFFGVLYWFQRDRDHLSEAKVIRIRKSGLLLDLLDRCPHGCGHAKHLPGLCRHWTLSFKGKGVTQCPCEVEE